jgi:hypothetical protein
MARLTITSVAAGVALAIGGAAVAQQPGQSQDSSSTPYHSFQSSEHGRRASDEMHGLDANQDQRIDQNEAQSDPALVAAWADIDVTRDGSIDATEYYLFAAQRRIAELEGGSASAESDGSAAANHAASSTASGAAGEAESTSRTAESRQQPAAAGESSASLASEQSASRDSAGVDEGGQRPATADTRDDGNASAGSYPAFEDLDNNSDGRLERFEVASLEGLDFSTADANQDGYVSREEYAQASDAH